MKIIKVFLPMESATISTLGFINELARLLPDFSFHEAYETGESPFLIQSALSKNTSAILVSLKRKDLLTLTAMAISLKISLIFFFEEKTFNLETCKLYFVTRLVESRNISVSLASEVSCEKNKGAQELAAQIPFLV